MSNRPKARIVDGVEDRQKALRRHSIERAFYALRPQHGGARRSPW
jgi:hypothetical protein